MTDDRERKPDEIDRADETASPVAASSPEPPASGDSPADAVAAYLLDALEDDERSEFETFLDSSPEAQAELRRLAPVVTLLPKLFELEPDESAPAASPELREQIIEAATAHEAVTPDDEAAEEPAVEAAPDRTIGAAPEITGAFEPKRRAARPPSRAAARPVPAPMATLSRFPTSWLVAAGLAIVAIGAIFWALNLQGRIDTKNREIAAQSDRISAQDSELAGLRENANATSFTLSAESDQAAGASGTVLYSEQDKIGVLYVRDLPALEDAMEYQLWYLDDESEVPRPGGTFRVDRNGSGLILVESDTPVFDGLAITVEPDGGSEAPTSQVVLSGRLGGARG